MTQRERYAANAAWREKRKAESRAWNAANAERKKATNALWYEQAQERVKARAAEWRKANPEARKAIKDRYRKSERGRAVYQAMKLRRRALEASAAGAASADQIMARVAYFGGRCWMCRKKATAVDHVKPLSRGGAAWPANLRPICKPCNSVKHARWPFPVIA